MIVALFASVLLAAAAQDPPVSPEVGEPPEATEEQASDVYAEEPADVRSDTGTEDSYIAEEPAEPVSQPVAEEAVEAAEPEPGDEQPTVCKRRSVYDAFGRQRSTRVCRPRDEW
ncbi:MAG TPA: hypothetical protein VN231_01485 [Allosphingosinicella sp.]|nr:hypothetical protein [Allosphingosinicella sp.]